MTLSFVFCLKSVLFVCFFLLNFYQIWCHSFLYRLEIDLRCSEETESEDVWQNISFSSSELPPLCYLIASVASLLSDWFLGRTSVYVEMSQVVVIIFYY